jgi:predicted MFS family arabinose efflux permease
MKTWVYSRKYGWYALLILTFVNLLNYFDRYLPYSLLSYIKLEFGISDFKLGLLGTAYIVTFASLTIPLGALADAFSRPKVIGASVGLWSLATLLSGISPSYWILLLARTLVGIGESSYGPCATAMISDYFGEEERARKISVFTAGMAIGAALGLGGGGVIAKYAGWREAFLIAAIPGLLLALLSWRLKERRRPGKEVGMGWKEAMGSVRIVLRTPTLLLVYAGAILVTFSITGLISWGPTFLIRKHGFDTAGAGIYVGAIGLISGVLGVLSGGYLADMIMRFTKKGRSICAGIGFLIGSPIMLAAVLTDSPKLVVLLFFIANFFYTWYNAPMASVIYDVVNPNVRATIMGSHVLVVHLFGGSMAPSFVGLISDEFGLQSAMEILPAISFIGGLVAISSSFFVVGDMAKARIQGMEPQKAARRLIFEREQDIRR